MEFSMTDRLLTSGCAIAAALTVAHAQQQPPTFGTTTRTVAIYATVTDSQGRLAPDLTRDSFEVDDNGVKQELTVFSNDLQPITGIMELERRARLAAVARRRAAMPVIDGAGRKAAATPTRVETLLVPEAEHEHGVAAGHRDVLFAVYAKCDGRRRDLAARVQLPEQIAVARVEHEKESFPISREKHVRGGRQDTGVGDVVHRERPLLLACRRVDGLHFAVRDGLRPGIHRTSRHSS